MELPLNADHAVLVAKMQAYVDATYRGDAKKLKLKKGIAVAAPQMGVSVRIVYIHFNENTAQPSADANRPVPPRFVEHKYLLANPKILSESVDYVYLANGEGCLSIEKKYPGYVFRKRKVVVEAVDLLDNNTTKQIVMHNFLSLCFQHELDHLNGILYYDRISRTNPFELKPNATKI